MQKFSKYTEQIWIISASLLILLNVSCKKYLDKKSDTALVVPSTLKDLQALLDNANNMNYSTSSYSITTADNFFLTDNLYNSQNPTNQAAYKWEPFDYNWKNDWSAAYFCIYNANICLEQVDKIGITSGNELQWNNVKGSAFFFRSFYFLNLACAHAKAYDNSTFESDLGIPIRVESDFNVASIRANVKDTYNQIISDGRQAANYLPDLPQHPLRPSKAAAYGLLARAYLSMREYDSAAKYSSLSLSIYDVLIDYKDPSFSINSANPFAMFNKETLFYSQPFFPFAIAAYSVFSYVDTSLYSTYTSTDLRRIAYFTPSGSYVKFKGNYTGGFNIFTGLATDEMYITRAECYAHMGNTAAALNDLNTLLAKRHNSSFVPITAADANDALNKILLERRKELLFRGLRWMDIKRLNKEGRNIILKRQISGQSYILNPNDDKYALPLPKDVISQSEMKQN